MLSCARFAVRVLFWSELYWPHTGGAEVFGRALIRALTTRGHTFTVVTSAAGEAAAPDDLVDGVDVYRFPFRAWQGGKLDAFRASLSGVAALKSRAASDLVHMNGVGPSSLFHLRTRGASPPPTLLTLQQQVLDSQSETSGTLLAESLRAADWVAGCSNDALSGARRLVAGLDSRSSVIWNGVPRPPVAPAPLPLDPPRLLCLGRLVPAKGFDLALEAFARIRSRFPGLTLDIAGDGSERESLAAQAERLGLADTVRFLGWVEPSAVHDCINTATLLLMPSRREGLPIVSIQAAQMGRPVIAARVGGLPEAVIDGETGILVPPDEVNALAAAADRLLSRPAELERMGRLASTRARAQFDWETTVERYDSLYREAGQIDRRKHA